MNRLTFFLRVIRRGLLAGFGVVLSIGSASGGVTYYHVDALGSPIGASNSSGDIIWRASYYPFGDKSVVPLTPDGIVDAGENTRWFTGHSDDIDTGLTYMQGRYYDPLLGRFMGVDSVGFIPIRPDSFNRYAYVSNNPYKFVDPDGRWAALAWPAAKAGYDILLFAVGATVATGAALDYVANNESSEGGEEGSSSPGAPDLPDDLIGTDNRKRPGKTAKTTGDLDRGSPEEQFDELTGGTGEWDEEKGQYVGKNGVRLRPGSQGEKVISVPAKPESGKDAEDAHFPSEPFEPPPQEEEL